MHFAFLLPNIVQKTNKKQKEDYEGEKKRNEMKTKMIGKNIGIRWNRQS